MVDIKCPKKRGQNIHYLKLTAREMKKKREGKKIFELTGHEDGVNCLSVSADGSVLVSGSEDCTSRVWSIEGPKEDCLEVEIEEEIKEEDSSDEGGAESDNKPKSPSASSSKFLTQPERCIGILRYGNEG